MKFKSRIINHFGVEPKVYKGGAFKSIAAEVRECVEDNLFMAMIGDPMCGKKTVIGSVIRDIKKKNRKYEKKHHIIYMQLNDDTRIKISQIVSEMILVLNDGDSIRRDFYARKSQLLTALGRLVYSEGETVTLILEQAQHLHGNTIRALKELRELSFLGESELFGIILTGHSSLRGKIASLQDVYPRVEFVTMKDDSANWLNERDRVDYLTTVWGDVLTASMRKHIAAMCFTPGEMDALVYERMKVAYQRGDTHLQENDFLPLKVIYEKSGLVMDAIAREAEVSKATASLAINGKYPNQDTVSRVKDAISRLTNQQISKAS
jgi:hypothetical protein